MMGAHIVVHVQPWRFPSERDCTLELPLSEELVKEAYAPLDYPNPDAGIAEVFCTPSVRRIKVMVDRKIAAKRIAETLTEAILESMSREDTVMGYSAK